MADRDLAREQTDALIEYMMSLDAPYRVASGYHDFYVGRQFSTGQERRWKETGLPLLALNKVRPHIDHMAAVMSAKDPMFRALPVAIGDEDISQKWDALFLWRWNDSDGRRNLMEIIRDALIYGAGYFHVYTDQDANFGRPHVYIGREQFLDVFPDPAARKADLSDAHRVMKRAHLSEEQVTARWGEQDWNAMRMALESDAIQSSYKDMGLSFTRADLESALFRTPRIYEVIEGYRTVYKPYVSLWDNRGFIRGVGPKEQLKGREFAINALGLKAVEFQMPRIEMIVSSGDVLLDNGVLETSRYPLIPYFNAFDDTVIGVSEIMFLQHSQEAFNSSVNLMLRWMATSSNAPWVVQKGTVDKEEWSKLGAVQGAILEVERSATLAPARQNPPSMPQGIFAFAQMLHDHMEQATGVTPISQGDASGAPETFRATLQLEEFANRRMGFKRKMLYSTLRRVGLSVMDFAQATYTVPEIIRVVSREGIDIEQEINTSPMNDITVGAYDVAVGEDSTMATSVQAQEAIEMERFKLGLVDRTHYITHSGIPDKEELLQRMSEQAQAAGTIQQLQQQIRSLQIQLTNLDSEVRRSKRQVALTEFESELESKLAQETLRLDEEKAKLHEAQRRLAFEIRKAQQHPTPGPAKEA